MLDEHKNSSLPNADLTAVIANDSALNVLMLNSNDYVETCRNAGAVELLVGPYRCGKTSKLIDQLISAKSADPLSASMVLVPSARYGKIFKQRILARLKKLKANEVPGSKAISGIFGIEILPFYQFCLRTLSNGANLPKVLPEELRPVLMSKILLEMHAKGELFSLESISELQGTGASISELIDELQRAGLTPNELIHRLEDSSCQESHLLELARVYDRYHSRLQTLEYFDQKSLALSVREILSTCTQKPDYQLLVIDGFDRVSHLQAQVFAGLAKRAVKTLISFDYVSIDEAEEKPSKPLASITFSSPFRQNQNDYIWKKSSFEELRQGLTPRIVYAEDLAVSTVSISESESYANLSTPELLAIKPAQATVTAASLLDPFMEMQEVTRQIKQAIKHRKISPTELIVITRSVDAYQSAISAAFVDAGIPHFIDGSGKLSDLQPWRFIRDLFNLSKQEFKRKSLIDLLRSPYFNLEALSMTARDVSIVDRNSHQLKLIGGIKRWESLLSRNEYAGFGVQIVGLLNLLQQDEACRSSREHSRLIEDLLDKFMKLPGSSNDLQSLFAALERETIKALRHGLKVLILQEDLLNQAQEPFSKFWQRLQKLVENASYPRPRPKTPAVTICSAELVPNMLFKEIYVCGVVEGEFPKHQVLSGFLSPEQTRLWLSYGIDLRNPRQEPGFERALFYSLTERATERLFFSMPQFNSKTEETISSFYLDELLDTIGQICKRVSPFEQGKHLPLSSREALASTLWNVYGAPQRAAQLSTLNRPIGKRWNPISNSMSALLCRSEASTENLFNGYLRDFFESGALAIPQENDWTATKINDYGKCPFRYWTNHILSLRPREEAESGLNFALIGQFYHKVLEIFFSERLNSTNNGQKVQSESKAIGTIAAAGTDVTLAKNVAEAATPSLLDESTLQASSSDTTTSTSSDMIESAFQKGLLWLEQKAEFQPGPYWPQEIKDLRFRIRRFIERELQRLSSNSDSGNFMPSYFEVSFGRSSATSFPPLSIQGLNGRNILLKGSIDRVDIDNSSTQAQIVDYKSGSRSISIKDAQRGRNLQLPIYALAFEKCIKPGISVTKADYLSISVARSVGRLNFQSDKHEDIKALAVDYIREYDSSARRGIFTVKPNGKDVCKDCPQSTACRVGELNIQTKESYDASSD